MVVVRFARVIVLTSQRFLALENAAARFRDTDRVTLSYRLLHCGNIADGRLR